MNGDPTQATVQDAEDCAAAYVLKVDLASQGGQQLVQLIEAQLADRMAKLANQDPYCRALLDILGAVGYQLALVAGKQAKLAMRDALDHR